MRASFHLSLLAIAVALAVIASQAVAQNVIFDAPGLLEKKAKPGAPDVKAAPQAWPRLDPGAALCRTEADLDRLAANRAHTEGAGPADCQIMRVPTAIQIVQRAGPGHTQVRLSEQATTVGWTDVWLPDKAPGQNSPRPIGNR